jgi:hypothetical protein
MDPLRDVLLQCIAAEERLALCRWRIAQSSAYAQLRKTHRQQQLQACHNALDNSELNLLHHALLHIITNLQRDIHPPLLQDELMDLHGCPVIGSSVSTAAASETAVSLYSKLCYELLDWLALHEGRCHADIAAQGAAGMQFTDGSAGTALDRCIAALRHDIALKEELLAEESQQREKEKRSVENLLDDVHTLEEVVGTIRQKEDVAQQDLQRSFLKATHRMSRQYEDMRHSHRMECDRLERELALRRADFGDLQRQLDNDFAAHPLHLQIARLCADQLVPTMDQLAAVVDERKHLRTSLTTSSSELQLPVRVADINDPTCRMWLRKDVFGDKCRRSQDTLVLLQDLDSGGYVLVLPSSPQRTWRGTLQDCSDGSRGAILTIQQASGQVLASLSLKSLFSAP